MRMRRDNKIDLSRVNLVAGVDHPERNIHLFSVSLLVEEEATDIRVTS